MVNDECVEIIFPLKFFLCISPLNIFVPLITRSNTRKKLLTFVMNNNHTFNLGRLYHKKKKI